MPLHPDSTPSNDPPDAAGSGKRLADVPLQPTQITGGVLQFTIEARELTNEYTHRPAHDTETRRFVVEADDANAAIHRYVVDKEAELVSFTRPGRSQESIATVKKEDSVYLVRIYAA